MDRKEYREQGYTLARDFLPPAELDAVRADAREVFLAQMRRRGLAGPGDPDEREFEFGLYRFFTADLDGYVACSQQVQHLISLNRLAVDERVVSALRDLGLEFPNVSTRPLMLFNSRHLAKREVYWRLPLHQDWRNMQGSLDALVVWLPLVDVDRSLGALEILPGSHTWGLLEAAVSAGYPEIPGDFDEARFVSCEMRRGDVLFFSAFLLHRSGTNATDLIRWSCQLRYNNLREPTFLERGFPHPYVYKPCEELITPGFPNRETLESFFS
jgi:phytanoyl-CoA hydroxylase